MKPVTVFFAVLVCVAIIAGCSAGVPTEMKLTTKRKVNNEPGTSINAMRFACADAMLNLSPATEATHIDAHVVSAADPVTIEVDAILKNFGAAGHDLPVTYHCEYLGGSLTLGKWTRGLTTGSK